MTEIEQEEKSVNLALDGTIPGTEGIETLLKLYRALEKGDVESVQNLVAKDLEWWFHGPPKRQHLMRMLTGKDRLGSFCFDPIRVSAIDACSLVAEGKGPSKEDYWVHICTVKQGKVVQIHEYFKTLVTVTGLNKCHALWQSQASATSSSLPGLIFVPSEC